jgi:2-polyprenyl-6-methoxyphenol hydroxylase-like FAD-dependent oxidoreductase
MAEAQDVVIIGGGFAGGALATALARGGKSVLALERTTVYRDLVRGEWIAPWGQLEAAKLDLMPTFMAAGGHHVARHVEYGEGIEPAEAEAAAMPLTFLPGVPGPLCIGHPAACNALNAASQQAGATVLRGVTDIEVVPGTAPAVSYTHDGARHTVRPRIVIGADGRNSTVRPQLGFELVRDQPHHWFSGLLVTDVPEWPADLETMGTEGDVQFFLFPQGEGRHRLYLGYPLEQKSRLSGENGARAFLDAFRLSSLPHADAIAAGTIAGPANSVPNESALVDTPVREGVVLVGDAAGWNDPIIGQGLSISLRDVRSVSEILLGSADWSPSAFAPYADERRERMRRLMFCAQIDSLVHAEFGEAAMRRRLAVRARRAADPSFLLALAGVMIGPEMLPAEAFSDAVKAEVAAMG